jgi:hypothetical protein
MVRSNKGHRSLNPFAKPQGSTEVNRVETPQGMALHEREQVSKDCLGHFNHNEFLPFLLKTRDCLAKVCFLEFFLSPLSRQGRHKFCIGDLRGHQDVL